MTKYVEKVVNDIVRASGHSFDEVLGELVSCGYSYACIWGAFMLFGIIWILVHRNG